MNVEGYLRLRHKEILIESIHVYSLLLCHHEATVSTVAASRDGWNDL